MNLTKPVKYQKGFTLFISLVLLVIVAGFVVSALNSSKVNLQVAANMKIQREMESAAQRAIETILTPTSGVYTYLATPPASPLLFHASGDDNINDLYEVRITIQCLYKGGTAGDDYSAGIKIQPVIMTYYNIKASVKEKSSYGSAVSGGTIVMNKGIRIPVDMTCS